MTPTLTSPGQLSARACSSSGKSIRWSVRCADISTQSSMLSWVLSRSLRTWSTKTLLGLDPTPHMCFRPYQDSPPPSQTPSMTQLLLPALAPDTHHQPSPHPRLPRSTITKTHSWHTSRCLPCLPCPQLQLECWQDVFRLLTRVTHCVLQFTRELGSVVVD